VIGVASKSRITSSRAAPAAHARARAWARAARSRSSSASPTDNSTRRAVEIDATSPNNAGCEPSATRSATQRPPSASITARSQNTRPGSCGERRSRVWPSAHPNASVNPSRSAANASSAVPARDESPLPSARTSTLWMLEPPITFKVRLLSGREGLRQPQLSLLRRTFQPAADANATRATGESGLVVGVRSGEGSVTSSATLPCHGVNEGRVMLTGTRRVRFGVRSVVIGAAMIAGLVPTTATAAPPTLTGETLSELDPVVTGACDPSASSTITFRATGFPFGPYETPYPYDTGTFTETGTATVGPQPDYQGGGAFPAGELTSFSATFSIETPDAKITGTQAADTLTQGAGICQEVSGDPDIGNAKLVYVDVSRLAYEARIVTAEGTFLDRGTSYVHVDRFTTDIGFPFASFSESFESVLTEPTRIPGSAEECKHGGYRDFPALDFKSQGECVAYVMRSASEEPDAT
jgi:hypothetical protein